LADKPWKKCDASHRESNNPHSILETEDNFSIPTFFLRK
jgi:hypothetical protein